MKKITWIFSKPRCSRSKIWDTSAIFRSRSANSKKSKSKVVWPRALLPAQPNHKYRSTSHIGTNQKICGFPLVPTKAEALRFGEIDFPFVCTVGRRGQECPRYTT